MKDQPQGLYKLGNLFTLTSRIYYIVSNRLEQPAGPEPEERSDSSLHMNLGRYEQGTQGPSLTWAPWVPEHFLPRPAADPC